MKYITNFKKLLNRKDIMLFLLSCILMLTPNFSYADIINGRLYVTGSDIALGLNDGRPVGSKDKQRAIVHADWGQIDGFTDDTLYLNFDGDFEGGVHVAGPGIIIDGKVGMGTSNPQNELDVNGTIRAKEVKVQTGWADFVFKDDYKLMALEDVEKHIKEKGHLPNIPSAKQVETNGVNLGKMQSKLLQKMEELTLYMLEQNKKITRLENENEVLKKRINSLEAVK